MDNLTLFISTIITYFILYIAFIECLDKVGELPDIKFKSYKFRTFCIIALLSLPLNINGNVFTVFGNIHSTGVKNIYSVFSPYQNAENNAFSLFGSIYQKAGKNAITLIGVSGYQVAEKEAMIFVGISAYQKSNVSDMIIGITGFQIGREAALHLIGLSLYQTANDVYMGIGFNGYQYGKKFAGKFLGLSIFQKSQTRAETILSMALLQKAGQKERSFAIWSTLEAGDGKSKNPESKTSDAKDIDLKK